MLQNAILGLWIKLKHFETGPIRQNQPKAVLWNAHLGLQPKYKVSNQITNTTNISKLGRKSPHVFLLYTQCWEMAQIPDMVSGHSEGFLAWEWMVHFAVHAFCASRIPANIDQGSCFAEHCALLEGSRPEGMDGSWVDKPGEETFRETPKRVNTVCSHRKS